MSVILGITDGDDGGAALIVDGRLVAAVSEERLNRMKMSIGFPHLAVPEVLRLAGKTPGEVDAVGVAANTEIYAPEARANKGWFSEQSTITQIRNHISSALAHPLGEIPLARGVYRGIKRMTMGRRRAGVRRALGEMGIHAPIRYHEHHECHALAAFDASGFDEALSLSLDGGGDGCSSHVYEMTQEGAKLLHRLDSFDSIGNYYAYVTHLCGFRATIHEGKITGLSASGEPLYKQLFEGLIRYDDGNIRNVGKLFYWSAVHGIRAALPSDWEHEDLAASIQQHLEEVATGYIRYWLRKSGKTKLCLSGGVFANVLLNMRLADLPECEEVFVFPAMGDGGLGAGAAFCEQRKRADYRGPVAAGSAIDSVYLGTSFSDEEIEAALKASSLPYRRYEDIEDVIATLVHEDRVVARFNGRMEYGPRALGNRTILYKASDPRVNTWLNKRLHRTEFMPFAPACLAGHEERLFHWNPASAQAARYMTITLACSDWMKETCPAVVHVDGTARPQIVDRETNPSFHRVIERYNELSGVPALVNTSFNMHEEPIVCTPDDAIRAFRKGRLDNLAIGPFLLGPEPGTGNVDHGQSP